MTKTEEAELIKETERLLNRTIMPELAKIKAALKRVEDSRNHFSQLGRIEAGQEE